MGGRADRLIKGRPVGHYRFTADGGLVAYNRCGGVRRLLVALDLKWDRFDGHITRVKKSIRFREERGVNLSRVA